MRNLNRALLRNQEQRTPKTLRKKKEGLLVTVHRVRDQTLVEDSLGSVQTDHSIFAGSVPGSETSVLQHHFDGLERFLWSL